MENTYTQVNQTLDLLENMIASQIESFSKGTLPDLDRHTRERDRAIRTLKADVDTFSTWARESLEDHAQSSAEHIHQRVADLLGMHHKLEEAVRMFRDDLRKNMQQLSKGKKTIRSYRSSYAAVNTPKVLSITN